MCRGSAGQPPCKLSKSQKRLKPRGRSWTASWSAASKVGAGVVMTITDQYVIAKNQAQGNIVIRLDRIDGVAGFVGEKK